MSDDNEGCAGCIGCLLVQPVLIFSLIACGYGLLVVWKWLQS